MSAWDIISAVGKGIVKSVQVTGNAVSSAAETISDAPTTVRDGMAVTEITSIFNTTDKNIRFVNRETPRDNKEILGQSEVTLKTEKTAGAWIPWFDPPRFGDFSRRRMEIVIDEMPVVYIWQKGDFIYWSNRLDLEGNPAKAYKIPGASHVGGKRKLVVRNDPDEGYSIFLSGGEAQ